MSKKCLGRLGDVQCSHMSEYPTSKTFTFANNKNGQLQQPNIVCNFFSSTNFIQKNARQQ